MVNLGCRQSKRLQAAGAILRDVACQTNGIEPAKVGQGLSQQCAVNLVG